MSIARTLIQLLSTAPRRRMAQVGAVFVLAGLSEGGSVLMLVPLLETLTAASSASAPGNQGLQAWMHQVGLQSSLLLVLGGVLGLVGLRCVAQVARERLSAQWQHEVVNGLRQRCFDALLHARWRWLADSRHSDHASLLLTDMARLSGGLNAALGLVATLVMLAVYLVAALALSWQITALALISGAVILATMARQRGAAVALGQRLGSANRALHEVVQESLAGLKLAKVLGAEPRASARFMQSMQGLQHQHLDFVAVSSRSRGLFQFVGAALLMLYVYAGLTWAPTPPATLITLVLVFARVLPLLGTAQQQAQQALHASPVLVQAQALLATAQQAAEPALQANTPAWSWHREIRLEGVSVQHPGRSRPALDAVSLVLPANRTTAVIGTSGAGKSTLADVLAGLLEPDAGRLLADGVPVEGAGLHGWRRQVAYVPQDAVMFHDSVRNNLRWSCPDADDERLWTALRAAAAADFVAALPQGLDTVIGDAGSRLSGGERQRLALARALLQAPNLLILDEATSALDTDNEARIREAIEHLHGRLTVLVIGHRLPTLEHADQVVRLEAGRVVACGSWKDIAVSQMPGPAPNL